MLLYVLGLSYGAVSLTLEALACSMCKNPVYDAVQRAAERVPGLSREAVFGGVRTPKQAVADLSRLGELTKSRHPQKEAAFHAEGAGVAPVAR